jgi:hypothetical protein
MVIYECDMCGKQSKCERDMHEMSVGGRNEDENLPFGENVECVMVCNECYGKIGDFIRGYKSRMNGLNCTIDSQFARKDKQ